MNWESWLLSGFLATLALSTVLSLSQGIGLTRMNIPYLLGTMVTPDRQRAKLYGFVIHIVNGWLFSILYVWIFESQRLATWWFGMLIGLAQALFVLTVGMTLMPSFHPRMASEQHGPNASRQLEPPGFMALNYGFRTPLSVFIAHAAYGAMLGSFYQLR
ncbi:MAG TPA: hypothetical protein VK555_00495 [Terriglobales bacterium]|jgi:uncharacterized membrane protein YagU involved in acid resistance|nr:hypothetical protein [Terriglobales bacterium]